MVQRHISLYNHCPTALKFDADGLRGACRMTFSVYISVAALAVSISTLVFSFIHTQRQLKIDALFKQRDYYLQFLQYCIDNAELDTFDIPNSVFESKGYDKKSIMIVYQLLLAGERQFLYDRINNKRSTSVKDWKPWLDSWSRRKEFAQMWDVMRPIFLSPDRHTRDFVQLIEEIMTGNR